MQTVVLLLSCARRLTSGCCQIICEYCQVAAWSALQTACRPVPQVNELQSAVMKIGENLQKAAGGSEGGASDAGAGGSAEGGTTYDAEAKEEKK